MWDGSECFFLSPVLYIVFMVGSVWIAEWELVSFRYCLQDDLLGLHLVTKTPARPLRVLESRAPQDYYLD